MRNWITSKPTVQMPREIPLKNAEGGQQIEQLYAKKNKSAVKRKNSS